MKSSSRATVSGPSVKPAQSRSKANDKLAAKVAGTAESVAAMPYKPILAIGESTALLDKAGVAAALPSGAADPGLLLSNAKDISKGAASFMAAIGKHRAFERQMDPPPV